MTPNEKQYCSDISFRLVELKKRLTEIETPLSQSISAKELFTIVSSIREIQGNISNDVSFSATLLAKDYLNKKHDVTFDASSKAQGAPGIDIDIIAPDKSRIVAEIKTTQPYGESDFGSAQRDSIIKDLERLNKTNATTKYMFVTDPRSFAFLNQKYMQKYPSVILVNLVQNCNIKPVLEQPSVASLESNPIPQKGFIQKITQASRKLGFINISASNQSQFSHLDDDAQISLLATDNKNKITIIPCRINRTYNPNGSPRIIGNSPLKDWLNKNIKENEDAVVSIDGLKMYIKSKP